MKTCRASGPRRTHKCVTRPDSVFCTTGNRDNRPQETRSVLSDDAAEIGGLKLTSHNASGVRARAHPDPVGWHCRMQPVIAALRSILLVLAGVALAGCDSSSN